MYSKADITSFVSYVNRNKDCCTLLYLVLLSSDVVLEANASPWGCLKAENFDASVSCQLPRYFIGLPQPQKNCLASVSTLLPLPRLGVHLLWLVPITAALVVTVTLNSILVTYFHVHSFWSVIAFYQQSNTVYLLHFLHLHILSLIVCNFSTCIASAFSWPSFASPWAFATLPQPISFLPRPYLASHLSCVGLPCLAESPYCLSLEKNALLHHCC